MNHANTTTPECDAYIAKLLRERDERIAEAAKHPHGTVAETCEDGSVTYYIAD